MQSTKVIIITCTFGIGARSREVLLVDTVAQALGNPSHDGPPDLGGGHLPELGGGRVAVEGSVWRAEQVWRVLQRPREHVEGLVLVHIQGGRPDAALLEGLGQGIVVHQTASSRVHQKGTRPHLLDGELVDQVVVVFVQGAVERHTIRLTNKTLLTYTTYL